MTIGLHMGYWWGTEYGKDLKKMISLTAETGVDYIEINPRYFLPLTSEERKALRKYAEDQGIWITVNGGPDKSTDLASDDPEARRAGLAFSRKVLDAARDFGAPTWSGVLYSEWLRKPVGAWPDSGDEIKRARAYCVQSLTELGYMLKDYNVVCCLEIVNRYEQFIVNTARDGVALAEATECDQIQLLLDVFHMNIEEDNIPEALRYAAAHKRLGHLHAGESNRRVPCGGGNICWEEIGQTLKEIHYDKMIVMEPFELTMADNAHRTCVWRNLQEQPTDIARMVQTARSGCEYLRGIIK